MIKRIELINFMSHPHTVIEPAAGLTVLVGPNNCGKSAVVAALQILCHNDNSTYVLRHQETSCQVIVETDEGHVIQWSRKKNGSPKYTINGKTFDRLKQGVPPELHAALRLPKVRSDKQEFDIHFGEQKRPVFLLNDSARVAAEFFASSSDASRLVEMQALHKQKVRDARRDQTGLLDEKRIVESRIEVLAPVSKVSDRIVQCERHFVELSAQAEDLAAIKTTIGEIVNCSKTLLQHESAACCYTELTPPPEFELTDELETLHNELAKTHRQAELDFELSETLRDLRSPPEIEEEHELERLIAQLRDSTVNVVRHDAKSMTLVNIKMPPEISDTTTLHESISNLSNQFRAVAKLDGQLKQITLDLNTVENEIRQWAISNPVCPLCKGPVKASNLVDLTGLPTGERP